MGSPTKSHRDEGFHVHLRPGGGHLRHAVGYGGGQTSHVSVSKPYQGEVRSNAQSKAFGSPIASHSSHDSVANTAAHGVAAHLGQGAVHGVHGVHHGAVHGV